ncbi:TetR/AcrR family transcriptional regulator [Amycolatopsis albispora]|uniref:TetR family transcriptional regulator n=1 Tax=Amycolatopsis albispora TaxID=1804986 RepID=A0A344L3V0_9PSEU|nr:TetR/AcrR family transcriptional regulator [Amycolatopsis albispora]AXB42724.1 TetR family transcriptional regulator [Amycolatopsis albispora]
MGTAEQAGPVGAARAGRRADRRGEILRATMAVIAERGYRGASLAAVAERVGITQQGLLHYFPTKEDLLIAVLEARDEWDTGAAGKQATSPWPLDLLATLIEYNASRPGVVQTFSALLGESVTEGHPAQDFFARRYATIRTSLTETLREEFGDRLPGNLTPEAVAPLVIAVMDGMQFQWLLEPGEVDMPAAFRTLVQLLRQAT